MKRVCIKLVGVIFLQIFISVHLFSQTCNPLSVTYGITESRCVATGAVVINAGGGSGNYQYKVTGPVSTGYSSVNKLEGLLPGKYLVTIQDLQTNCIYQNDSITIPGTYQTPAFLMTATRASCGNTADGTITVNNQQFGRAPFSYKIIAPSASAVGTVSSTGNFSGLIAGSYLVQLSDSCGALQTKSIQVPAFGWKINIFSAFKNCDTLNVSIGLKDDDGNLTPSSAFDNFQYGVVRAAGDTIWYSSYDFKYTLNHRRSAKIVVKDPCGTIKTEIWEELSIPSLGPSAIISNKACSTFTVAVTGALNLSANTQYCLFNNANVSVACNANGTFNNVPYGSYCIKAIDPCYDTTITRCVNVNKLVPAVDTIVQVIFSCVDASFLITGQLNLSNPNYCLYNSSNVLIACNSTGSFVNMPYGNYCIKITNNPLCYDTVITRCFSALKPIPAAAISITNQTCASFTASVVNAVNLSSSQYCLYSSSHILIGCNATGVFNNLAFGSYCIEMLHQTICGDTVINACFTVARPLPAVANNVLLSANDCPPFTAAITGQVGLNNPEYCLYNGSNVLIECNNTGFFTVLQNGSYCIKIKNDPACYDTVITRCFTKTGIAVDIAASSTPSCALIGGTDILVEINSGIPTYSISVYAPSGALIVAGNTAGNANDFTFTGVPVLPAPIQYKIVVTDLCGNKDSVNITPVSSILNRVVTVTGKCPSGSLPNGSGDVVINYVNNNIGGQIRSEIIRRNGAVVSIAGTRSGPNNYISTFTNLSPGTYVISTNVKDCDKDVFDTVVVKTYISPDLLKSAAYICDNNSLSVGAAVTGGVAPFQYEIIGSVPVSPAIISAPQSNPLFTINNATQYSMIRLRAVDACGNAGLNDVGIVPLGAVSITSGYDCYYLKMVLQADSIPNTTYRWYKKTGAADSTFIGTGSKYIIPYLLPSDTGRYVSVLSVNNGCISRLAYFNVTAGCSGVLQQSITLNGKLNSRGGTDLEWNISSSVGFNQFEIEYSSNPNGQFKKIGILKADKAKSSSFLFTDQFPSAANNYYRLKIVRSDLSFYYSNTVVVHKTTDGLSIFPNPVENDLSVNFKDDKGDYLISMTDLAGRKILELHSLRKKQEILHSVATIYRLKPGIYVLSVRDNQTGTIISKKVLIR